MVDRFCVAMLCSSAAAIILTVVPALAETPEGVSPGAVDRFTSVEGRCPTFIWGGVLEATAYELVVYRLHPELRRETEFELSASDRVLFAKVPGGATAWQPGLADGLDPGGSYVWFVRAVLLEDAGNDVETGDWSEARFFSIPAAPSAEQVRQALEILRMWKDDNGDGSLWLSSAAANDAAPVRSAVEDSGARRDANAGTSLAKSVPTASAAIRGSIPDVSGEVYGVVGLSNSPDGAGVGAANTAGGPDLVLDGSEDFLPDTEFDESGIDRPWGTQQTFEIRNSLGAGMTLLVDGVEVTTTESDLDAGRLATGTVPGDRLAGTYSGGLTLNNPANEFAGSGVGLTGVDADTLDGTDGEDYVTDTELAAANYVTSSDLLFHGLSGDHDGRYFTEAELSTAGTADAVHWDNIGGVPPGFADGVDDDTVPSTGPGLTFDGSEIRIDWSHFLTSRSTIDSAGIVGFASSIAIGTDGLGLISYFDLTNGDLKVAHCSDSICSSVVDSTLDSAGTVGKDTSVAIGADGLGLVSYYDDTNEDLKVAHCIDSICSGATTSTVDSDGDVGRQTSIAIGSDGLGLISYLDATNYNLKVAHCNNTACTSATTTTLDSSGIVGGFSSTTIGADGLGLISYNDGWDGDLKVAHCNDIACTSATTTTLDSAGDVGLSTSIAIGIDGLGLISYYDQSNGDLKVAHCNDTTCTSASTTTLDSAGSVGWDTSITIGADGLGLISYRDNSNGTLKVARCNDATCSFASTPVVDSSVQIGAETSIALGSDGLGLISYYVVTSGDLRVAHLGIGVP